MPSLPVEQVPTVLVLALGLAVVVAGFHSFPHPGQKEYHHSVNAIQGTDVPDGANVTDYGDLSTAAQRAFHAALEREDGTHVVYGEASAPPDWTYRVHDDGSNAGYYVIRYDGSYYELETEFGEFEFLDVLGAGFAVLYGAVSLAVGTWLFRRERSMDA